jgi:hypothetical protein
LIASAASINTHLAKLVTLAVTVSDNRIGQKSYFVCFLVLYQLVVMSFVRF